VTASTGLLGAYAFGFALGAAPGPVQLLILTQTARRGFTGGLRVMLGANLTLFAILVALALGLATFVPSDPTLRMLHVAGGALLIGLGVTEMRALVPASTDDPAPEPSSGWGPTFIGIGAVLLNPGAWLFLATTAAVVLASAAADDGRAAALGTALAIAVGVSSSDLLFSIVGSGGRRILGERGLRWIRGGLGMGLIVLGIAFAIDGVRG
jgi:threonine/homoserine/homoserine lactone efflux protein